MTMKTTTCVVTGGRTPFKPKTDANAVLARVLRADPDGLLTRGEASALIALRARDAGDSDRTARNRAGQMLDRACQRGSVLHQGGLPRQADGRFTVNDVVYLAQRKFPELFSDLPCRPVEVCLELHDGFSLGVSVEQEATPSDLKGCQTLVEALRAQIKQFHADKQHAEVERKREVRSRLDHDKKK